MYSPRVYTSQDDSQYYERYVESFINWASIITNRHISGDIFVLLSDGHLLCDLIIYIFPQFRDELLQIGFDPINGDYMMIYCFLCDKLHLDENHRVTNEILVSHALDQLVHVLEDLISTFLKYYSATVLKLPDILHYRRTSQYCFSNDPVQFSNPYPHGVYHQGYSVPMPTVPEVHVSPVMVPSVSEDIPSISSVTNSSQSESHLFKSEEVSNQLKHQQHYLDLLENNRQGEDYETMTYSYGANQVNETRMNVAPSNKKKLAKAAVIGSSVIAATGIVLGVVAAVSKAKKK